MRILIIEDSPATTKLITELVTKLYDEDHPEIVAVASAAAAFAELPTADVVLLDLELPDSTAEESIARFVSRKRPTVVCSQHSDSAIVQAALDAGATGYWIKGGSAEQFAVELLRAAAKRTRRSQLATELIKEMT